jgi:hypothetical protein
MNHGWGSFRTTEGDVVVGDEVLRIDRSSRKFLQGQRSRWRHGSHEERLKAAARIVLFLILFLSTASQLYRITEAPTVLAVLAVFGFVAGLVGFWAKRVRGTAVPLSAIEGITLDTDERELTIVHDANSRPSVLGGKGGQQWFPTDDLFSIFVTGETETTLTLRTADDAREARTIFRTRGIVEDIDTPKSGVEETETEYHFETKNGVVFCEQCGSQVSPSDRTCPACDHALRVERAKNDDSRELSTEF